MGKLIKEDIAQAKKFLETVRFIDDLCTLNDRGFQKSYKNNDNESKNCETEIIYKNNTYELAISYSVLAFCAIIHYSRYYGRYNEMVDVFPILN